MKKFVIAWFCLQPVIFSQYFGERVTDQSFEKSSLYFNSHFLNIFAIYQFKDVAVGLIDDPFLNNYLNPALLPNIDNKNVYLYLDFRGDRKEALIAEVYPWRDYYFGSYFVPPIFDSRWFTTSSGEPEPIVSFAFVTYPFSENRKYFIGGSYQVVYSEDKFYSIPYNIYSPLLGYDAFNNRLEMSTIPVIDRYSGKDEMINEIHRFTGFTGYKFSDIFSVGLSINGVFQNKDGVYSNYNSDEFGTSDYSEWNNSDLTGRTQEYDHLDYSAGFVYSLSDKLIAGIKAGYLDGGVKQYFISTNSYSSIWNEPNVSEEWHQHYSNYKNEQIIDHDGSSKYIGFNMKGVFKKGAILSGYYRYTFTDVSVTTTSNLMDTSKYSSRWTHNGDWSVSYGDNSIFDNRSGAGNRKSYTHEGLVSLNWNLSEVTSVSIGLYVKNEFYKINNVEDVIARRNSEWNYDHSEFDPEYYLMILNEDKTLEWEYESSNTTYQIPVILDFRFNEYWGIMFGVNRILNSWRITDLTTAFFDQRYKNDNGEITEENNFGERYTQPTERITDNFFDVTAGINLNITKEFGMRLMIDPEIEPSLRIAQWWLAFKVTI